MKLWKRITAAALGICMAGGTLLGTSLPTLAEDATEPICSMPLYSTGDINCDHKTDLLDVVRMHKYLIGAIEALIEMPAEEYLQPNAREIAMMTDLNGDQEVDIFDLSLLERLVFFGTFRLDKLSSTQKLSAGYAPHPVQTGTLNSDILLGQTDFALDLLRLTAAKEPGENVLVSPYSVSQALGMTANGAKGKTRSEMESVLGGSMEALNPAFYAFRTSAPFTPSIKLSTANSIWVRNGYPVREDFLQTNADYYAADAFSAPFDDQTLEDINNWVDENTDHMIPSILDYIPADAELYLVNAVAFDAEWANPYTADQIGDGTFTAADGKKQNVQMMHGEFHQYLSDAHATGFMQYYTDYRYAFAAMLPEEGMTTEEYLDTLTAKGLREMLSKPEDVTVYTALPEFKYDYSKELSEELIAMGMPTAFDSENADFSGMTDSPLGLFINRVLHKTHIEVTPQGTRAGAATVVEMCDGAEMITEEPKHVTLDRPFVYMIVDTDTDLPVFFGTVNSIG